jgi:hypothetical protein
MVLMPARIIGKIFRSTTTKTHQWPYLHNNHTTFHNHNICNYAKIQHALPPLQYSHCLCLSCPRVFKNLYKHVSQQLDCLAFVQSLRQSILHKSKTPDLSTMPVATIISSTNAVVCPLIDDPNHIPDQMSLDDQFPLQDDANCDEPHDYSQYQAASKDYEQPLPLGMKSKCVNLYGCTTAVHF